MQSFIQTLPDYGVNEKVTINKNGDSSDIDTSTIIAYESMMNKKKPNKRSKLPAVIGTLLFLLIMTGCGVFYLYALADGEGPTLINTIIMPKPERMNVLLLGNDARAGETIARTDSIMLACVDPKQKQVALLSIPRDSYVSIPGYGKDKINHASVYGGPELT
ncbi:MAG: LCP family protein, partial [Peptococcaceae bacterium]|nr:LCP family protein [Peptococcaceae bacterium]